MKTGINLLLWTPVVTEEHFGIIEKLKAAGYDGVEVPLFSGEVDDYKRIGQTLKDTGLACTTCTVMPDEEHNPISADPNHRKGGVEYLKWVIDCCEALGAEVLCGPYYHPLGTFTGVPPTAEEKERGAEVHREVAAYAEKAGVVLAIECLNRFECYFLNTIDDGAAYAKQVGHGNFGVMYDAFHANIEEKDPIGCIGRNMDMIRHVHVSENDRGTPGKGHIPFGEIFKALRAGGYDQWLTIEAFGRSMPELAATTCVWRDLSTSPEECYGDGLKMIKETWEAAA
jgi:D-psicose/D-tagatose/L-ribulose 3-epimerase